MSFDAWAYVVFFTVLVGGTAIGVAWARSIRSNVYRARSPETTKLMVGYSRGPASVPIKDFGIFPAEDWPERN